MKIQIVGKPTKTQYVVFFIILLAILSNFLQYSNNKDYENQLEKEITELKNEILVFNKKIDSISKEKETLYYKIDSIKQLENHYKNRYYVTKQELKNVINDYYNSDNERKNELFTKAINE